MLNYHKLLSQAAETKVAKFQHFLTLGSHQSCVSIQGLASLSIVHLYSETKLIVNQENEPENTQAYAIPLTGNVRINQRVYAIGDVVHRPKYINEIEKKQTSLLYLVVKGSQENKQHGFHKLQGGQAVKLSERVKISKITYKASQSLEVNKRILILVLSGSFRILETKQQIVKHQCVYSKKGCGQIQFIKDSQIVLLQFLDATVKNQ